MDANELQAGKPMQGTYLSPEDEDWYRLLLAPGASDVLRIEVTPVAGARPELEVRTLQDASLLATFRGNEGLFVRDLSIRLGESASSGADGGLEDAGPPDAGVTQAGYYRYRCVEHPQPPGMQGLVFVSD